MKPQSAKSKGRKFQQWVRDFLLDIYSDLQPDDIRSTSMGAGGEDILLSAAARVKIPYTIECKARKTFSVYTIMEQAESHEDHTPLVVLKGNHKKPVVVMYAEDFKKLLIILEEKK